MHISLTKRTVTNDKTLLITHLFQHFQFFFSLLIMPPKTKRQKQVWTALLRRYKRKKEQFSNNEGPYDSISMATEKDGKGDDFILSDGDDDDSIIDVTDFKSRLDLFNIGDLFEICKLECGSRKLSVLVYMILRYFDQTWRNIDCFLQSIGGCKCQVAHEWTEIFLNGDLGTFEIEKRGGKHADGFYDFFPELENEAKAFVVESCAKKSAAFTTLDLAKYIDRRYYEITGTPKTDDALVRSPESCRLDLRHWGAKFQPNSQRPYFEGHERDDVVKHRDEFVSYFLARKDKYYTISDEEKPTWHIPKQNPCVLICEC